MTKDQFMRALNTDFVNWSVDRDRSLEFWVETVRSWVMDSKDRIEQRVQQKPDLLVTTLTSRSWRSASGSSVTHLYKDTRNGVTSSKCSNMFKEPIVSEEVSSKVTCKACRRLAHLD